MNELRQTTIFAGHLW